MTEHCLRVDYYVADIGTAGVRERLLAMQRASREEPGCLEYSVFESLDVPTHLFIFERYRDAQAHQEHMHSLHFEDLIATIPAEWITQKTVERCLPLAAQGDHHVR
jgi:quinol monooxygenase YgiN